MHVYNSVHRTVKWDEFCFPRQKGSELHVRLWEGTYGSRAVAMMIYNAKEYVITRTMHIALQLN